jgi:hypothetical protein
MIYTKLIQGWVAQKYDSETGDCVSQSFIAAEAPPLRQDEDGNAIADDQQEELANTEKEMSFDMVQP